MATTINASTSGGLVQTADTSGTLQLQSAGTTQFTVDSTGAYGTLEYKTAVASTSGTSIDFTGIPSWAKRITVMFNGVSTNNISIILVQLGSTTYTTTGYVGSVSQPQNAGATAASNFSTGFMIDGTANGAAVRYGTSTLVNISGNNWIQQSIIGRSDALASASGAGSVALSGTLDRVRITTVNGTDTFDAGTVNIIYEG